MASAVRTISPEMPPSDMFLNCGCDQLWFPISWPSAAIRFKSSSLPETLLPSTKKVALAPCSASPSSRREV